MSISALSNWQLYANQYYSGISSIPALQSTTDSTTETTSAISSIQGTSNSSGDSFQLSGSSPSLAAGLYGPPPPPPPGSSNSTSSSTTSSDSSTLMNDIQSFLAKVADGSVTDSDLTDLKSELQGTNTTSSSSTTGSTTNSSSASSAIASTSSTSGSGGLMSDIQSFLAKVADGSVTDSDLTDLKSELQSAQQAAPPPLPPSSGSATSSSSDSSDSSTLMNDIQSFLAKVADGSVTDSDLTALKSELQDTSSTYQV